MSQSTSTAARHSLFRTPRLWLTWHPRTGSLHRHRLALGMFLALSVGTAACSGSSTQTLPKGRATHLPTTLGAAELFFVHQGGGSWTQSAKGSKSYTATSAVPPCIAHVAGSIDPTEVDSIIVDCSHDQSAPTGISGLAITLVERTVKQFAPGVLPWIRGLRLTNGSGSFVKPASDAIITVMFGSSQGTLHLSITPEQ
jgi:hypothetical protein